VGAVPFEATRFSKLIRNSSVTALIAAPVSSKVLTGLFITVISVIS